MNKLILNEAGKLFKFVHTYRAFIQIREFEKRFLLK